MQMTDWFLAKEDEAEQIASIVTTEEREFEDWPHIEFPLIELELMALSATLQGKEDLTGESILEKPRVWDEEGYGIAGSYFPTRRAAEAFARVTPHPAQPEPTSELLAARAMNMAAVDRIAGRIG